MGKVCFTAVAEKGSDFGPFSADTKVVFERAVTNLGNAYDHTSGIFKAPVSGFYFFSFSYQGPKTNMTGLSLFKNHSALIKTFDHTKPGGSFIDNGGNTAVLKLNAGDEVSVRLPANTVVHAYEQVTTFSGFLIAEE